VELSLRLPVAFGPVASDKKVIEISKFCDNIPAAPVTGDSIFMAESTKVGLQLPTETPKTAAHFHEVRRFAVASAAACCFVYA